jgi:hypothetical protein
MSKLIGLAFTSPGVAFIAIDRSKYKVYYHEQSNLTDFRLFLDKKDNREPVVFLNNVRDLIELEKIADNSVKNYVLFEDPKVLSNIEGAILPDFKQDVVLDWVKIQITQDDFNKLLEDSVYNNSFNVTDKAIISSNLNTSPITFLELVQAVKGFYIEQNKDSTDFINLACKYVTKLISKKSWVSLARKPALAAGIPIKAIAEIEKSIETSKLADEIWRAFYEYSITGTLIKDLVKKYVVTEDDIHFIITALQAEPSGNLEFTATPGSSKRKKTKASIKQEKT